MVTAWLALIALQTVTSRQGSGKVAGAMADINRLVQRGLDSRVAAIPDRRTSRPAASAAPVVDPTARLADGTWPTYNVPAPGHQNWPSFNVPVPR
jgi:hypothetical protein